MIFGDEIDKNEMEDFSVANFLAITNKAYNIYLNQEIEDLDITAEQIPFIMELDKSETITKKELAKYLFLNDRNTARGLMDLYRLGIIDRKPLDKSNSDDKKDNDHVSTVKWDNGNKDENNYFNHNLEILLTPYGKELASKIKKIDAKWEELIYKNLEDSNKDEIMKNVKDLAISSLKTNKDVKISDLDAKISRTQKMFSKILNKMFSSSAYKHGYRHGFKSGHYHPQDMYKVRSDCRYDEMPRNGLGNFENFDEIYGMGCGPSRRSAERISDDAFRYMAYFKTKRFGERGPFFR